MLKLVNRITIIKNKNSKDTIQTSFVIPNSCKELLNKVDFINTSEGGADIALQFTFVNNVEIDSSFKNLTKTGRLTLPRNLDFDGMNIAGLSNPLFNRGDRIIIELGYEIIDSKRMEKFNSLKKIFQGYIVRVGLSTPVVLECEDQMYALKNIKVNLTSELGKKKLSDVLIEMFKNSPQYSTTSSPFDSSHKGDGSITPILMNLDTAPFTYDTSGEKSIAEVLDDLKRKLFIYPYFDDFGNLRIELPWINSKMLEVTTPIAYDNNVISDDLKLQREEDVAVKVIFKSQPSNKKETYVDIDGKTKNKSEVIGCDKNLNGTYKKVNGKMQGYVGDGFADSITVNGPNDLTQDECDKNAMNILAVNKYTGMVRGSKFTTFGEPAIYVGQTVTLRYIDSKLALKFQERIGTFAVAGVRRTFGMNGYRQIIELGIQLKTIDLSNFNTNSVTA